jgi:hypothetical protein
MRALLFSLHPQFKWKPASSTHNYARIMRVIYEEYQQAAISMHGSVRKIKAVLLGLAAGFGTFS